MKPQEKQKGIKMSEMTLRDYFAIKIAQGILSNPDWMLEYANQKYLMEDKIVADISFKYADALLKER